ncbi:hypothetical protein Q7C36_004124 [Tachysurus vachellii]|uniref:Uncharacterized protein n=1 Tax=Tachysurus vachellii TaxID=175792 RepID=A0AA88NPE2_TACVA|nr:hypothetical protein Q7C36_004124 [Tachysurus vachellii]
MPRKIIHVQPKPERKRGRSSSDGQLPPACNCRETVREALREFLPGAVEAALPAAGTPEPPDGDEVEKDVPEKLGEQNVEDGTGTA